MHSVECSSKTLLFAGTTNGVIMAWQVWMADGGLQCQRVLERRQHKSAVKSLSSARVNHVCTLVSGGNDEDVGVLTLVRVVHIA